MVIAIPSASAVSTKVGFGKNGSDRGRSVCSSCFFATRLKYGVAAIDATTPIMLPIVPIIEASIRIRVMICFFVAPRALNRPISFLLSEIVAMKVELIAKITRIIIIMLIACRDVVK